METLKQMLERHHVEKWTLILDALLECDGDKAKAARQLDVKRTTLLMMVKEFAPELMRRTDGQGKYEPQDCKIRSRKSQLYLRRRDTDAKECIEKREENSLGKNETPGA